MGWLDWLFGTKKIKELEKERDELGNKIASITEELYVTKKELDETDKILDGTLATLKKISDELKLLKEPNFAEKPEWMEVTNDIYKPSIEIVAKGSIYNINIMPKDIYAISPTLETIVEERGWRTLPQDQKLWQIWSFVTDRCDYEYDAGESWEYPTTTYYRRKGDCEDTTILFVTLCRISNVKPDSIFNVIGWWHMSNGTNVGHSYPIVRNEDGKWYVYETTLPSINASYQPKLFKGSNYTADFGMSNWLYSGRIKNGQNQV